MPAHQVIYVVTSTGCDQYSAMTRLSIASLRLTNPDIRVVVAVDAETDRAVRAAGDRLPGEVDEWRVFETPPGPAMFRNRFIKTNLRNLVDGPFLFLDSDTVVRGDLGPVFDCDADVAGAANNSSDEVAEQIGAELQYLSLCGWDHAFICYVNGGVLFCNETAGARHFSNAWHQAWLKGFRDHAVLRDQPSLNHALWDSGANTQRLLHFYNAQIYCNPLTAPSAVIWHLHATADGYKDTAWELSPVERTQRDWNRDFQATLVRPHPWRKEVWLHPRGKSMIDWLYRKAMCKSDNKGDLIRWARDLKRVDPVLLRLILQKVLVDSYWGRNAGFTTTVRVVARNSPGLLCSLQSMKIWRHYLVNTLRLSRMKRRVLAICKKPVVSKGKTYVLGDGSDRKQTDDAKYMTEPWLLDVLNVYGAAFTGCFLDVGANIGQTLWKLKLHSATRRYIGLEPNYACCSRVHEMIRQYQFEHCNIVAAGLYHQEMIRPLNLHAKDIYDSGASLVKTKASEAAIALSVNLVTYKMLEAAFGQLDLGIVKIDVEGAELEVLSTMAERVAQSAPLIIIEILPVYCGDNCERLGRQIQLEALIAKLGYKILRVYKTVDGHLDCLLPIENIGIHCDLNACDYLLFPSDRFRELLGSTTAS